MDIAYFNGEFLPRDDIRISPDDRGFLFADGIYEVLIAYNGRFFRKDGHLVRMANGLKALKITGADPAAILSAADELLERNKVGKETLCAYVQVTRGVAPRKHSFPAPGTQPTVLVYLMPFVQKTDPSVGTSVITVPDIRWLRCDVKSIALLPNCLANQQAQEAGAYEALQVRDGVVLEGTASSFFAVFDGVARTAPKSNYILPSITQDVVLEICRREGLPVAEQPIFLQELGSADEAFLAGTTTEIAPIVEIDGKPVGNGKPGPYTARVLELFRAETQKA
jgi:D-alanine transaminase